MNSNLKKELDKFGKFVVQQSRSRLTKGNKNVTKKLYNSIGFSSEVFPNSFSLIFEMEDYGEFQDRGVDGVKEKRGAKGYDGRSLRYTNKRPPAKAFSNWTVKKGIAPRDSSGKFTSRKGLQFAIARSIYEKGIKPSFFFSKPFEQAFKKLPDDIIEAYNLDIDNLLRLK